ncbi:MAG TPA: Smr/MutS family protein [Edaphocola sp.]|nr:Smr/MutS family protein [Edaphocola sp.]
MKFSVGDDVIILATGEEAEVLKILHPRILEVSCRGNVFPVFTKEVKLLSEAAEMPHDIVAQFKQQQKPVVRKQDVPADGILENGFYFSFQPVYSLEDAESIQELKVTFINQTSVSVMIHYQCIVNEAAVCEERAVVTPKTGTLFLHTLAFETMNDLPRFFYSLKPVEEETTWMENAGFYFSDQLKLRPKRLFEYLSVMRQKRKNTFEIRLGMPLLRPSEQRKRTNVSHETFENKDIQKGVKLQKAKPKSRATNEIDLHTEALGIATRNLDNFEILSRQLHALQMAIDAAIVSGRTSLVIIHGVGNGRLKEEVHLLLKGHPAVTFFQHSWRPRYGNGATEAFFK